ncbi:MAG: C-type lectin domain-containing protein [Verrucomicrobia bacterium]|nr:C-type lectin domain-containing protein [Verrucomicrobiota bacterium]
MRVKTFCILVGLLIAVTETPATEERKLSELDTLKQKYEEAQNTIDEDFSKKQSDASASYGRALESYMVYLKKEGMLDSYLAVEKATVRFEAEGAVPPAEARDTPYAKKAAEQYDGIMENIDNDRLSRTTRLARQYVVRLNRLIKKLMLADRIDEAKLAQLEVKRCQAILAASEPEEPKSIKSAAPSQPTRRKTKPAPPGVTIPAGALEYGSHHYKGFPESITWTEARARCAALGGHLVTVEDSDEDGFLRTNFVFKTGLNYWIGLFDVGDSEWRWVDGSTVGYTALHEKRAGNYVRYGWMYNKWVWWPDLDASRYRNGFICEWDH